MGSSDKNLVVLGVMCYLATAQFVLSLALNVFEKKEKTSFEYKMGVTALPRRSMYTMYTACILCTQIDAHVHLVRFAVSHS